MWSGSITSAATPSSTLSGHSCACPAGPNKVKYAFRWTRLSGRRFCDKEARPQLHALAHNLTTFLRCIELPEAMADRLLTSLELTLSKIGVRVFRHARAITLQLAEVAVSSDLFTRVIAAVHRLRAPPVAACA